MSISTPNQLVDEFKKSGQFDKLRRLLLEEFQAGENLDNFHGRIHDIVAKRLQNDQKLHLMPPEATQREIMQEVNRYPVVLRARDETITAQDNLASTIRLTAERILHGEELPDISRAAASLNSRQDQEQDLEGGEEKEYSNSPAPLTFGESGANSRGSSPPPEQEDESGEEEDENEDADMEQEDAAPNDDMVVDGASLDQGPAKDASPAPPPPAKRVRLPKPTPPAYIPPPVHKSSREDPDSEIQPGGFHWRNAGSTDVAETEPAPILSHPPPPPPREQEKPDDAALVAGTPPKPDDDIWQV